MHWALLAVLAFVVTVLETVIASQQTQSIANYTLTKDRKYIFRACWWATAFELVLLADILMLVNNPMVVTLPILLGAWLGMYWSFKKRA